MDLQMYPRPQKGSGSSVAVSDQVFDRPFNEDLVHQVITAYLAAGRQGTKAQKTRAEASGGGAKPWRQKGTGRARAGSIRSPLWRGGGKTFAARPRDFSQKVNRKMYRSAMRSIVSELVRQERLMPVDGFELGDVPRTKQLLERLEALGVGTGRTLIIEEPISDVLALSARNLSNVFVAPAATVDPVSLVGADRVLITADALKRLEERLG